MLIGVALFASLANRGRLVQLTGIDMLIMSYGGLRGALAFALALVLDEGITGRKKEFITAATVVILFTVFIQVFSISMSNKSDSFLFNFL
jgi:sodium/hydrogen exchanger-like protein 3